MKNEARVLSTEDLAHLRRIWFFLGALFGLCLAAAIAIAVAGMRAPISGRVVHQSAFETVAVVPVRFGLVRHDCVLVINHFRARYALDC